MSKKMKWEVEGLRYSKQLKKNANVILRFRIDDLKSIVGRYFKVQSVENLHDVRIALRRIRYSMELFLICYSKKEFIRFYNKVKKLQDLSGAVRDVDISIENFKLFLKENNSIIEESLFQKANEKKSSLEELFNSELFKFLKGKTFKDFYKLNF